MGTKQFFDFMVKMKADLERKSKDNFTISFSEISSRGSALPRSAFKHRAWWANHGSKAWLKAGLRTEAVDMEGQQVTFRLSRPSPSQHRDGDADGQAVHDEFHDDAGSFLFRTEPGGQDGPHPLVGMLRGKIRIAAGFDLTEPADPDWGKVYDE